MKLKDGEIITDLFALKERDERAYKAGRKAEGELCLEMIEERRVSLKLAERLRRPEIHEIPTRLEELANMKQEIEKLIRGDDK